MLWRAALHLMQRSCLNFLIWRTTDKYSHVLPAVAVMPVRVTLKWRQTVMGLFISGRVPTTWGQLWMGRIASKKPGEKVPTLKYFFATWGSHCSGFCSTRCHCWVERNVSDIWASKDGYLCWDLFYYSCCLLIVAVRLQRTSELIVVNQ